MKKWVYIFIFLVVGFFPIIGFSQKTLLSLGGEVALPLKVLSIDAGSGFGGAIRAENSWGKHFSGIATGGYLWFKSKDSDFISTTTKFRALPVQVGIKYFPLDKAVASLFVSTELGFMVTKREIINHDSDHDFKRRYFDLSVALGIGYHLRNFEPSFRLQFNLPDAGYNIYYLNFRIAYIFLKSKSS